MEILSICLHLYIFQITVIITVFTAGFNSHNKIKRARLDFEQIEAELKEIAKTGLEEILILTGGK